MKKKNRKLNRINKRFKKFKKICDRLEYLPDSDDDWEDLMDQKIALLDKLTPIELLYSKYWVEINDLNTVSNLDPILLRVLNWIHNYFDKYQEHYRNSYDFKDFQLSMDRRSLKENSGVIDVNCNVGNYSTVYFTFVRNKQNVKAYISHFINWGNYAVSDDRKYQYDFEENYIW